MWSNKHGDSLGLLPGRKTLGPLFLMTTTPVAATLITHIFVEHGGSVGSFLTADKSLYEIWPTPWDPTAWKLIGSFMVTQLVLMRVVPGKTSFGPVTPSGNVPKYQANGFQCFALSLTLFLAGAFVFDLYPGGIVYDFMQEIISALNVFSFVLCLFLYVKGAFLFQSSSDCGTSGNPIFDFYWGTELYPRVLGWDVKLFTNCRCGLMFWAVAVLSYACKQYELYGYLSDSMAVSVALQLAYVAKFFWWEAGYMCSIDIMHDRAGYYLCWGCLVWVPSVYTSPAMYLVQNPIHLGTSVALVIVITGVLMGTHAVIDKVSYTPVTSLYFVTLVGINYDADRQRQSFRAAEGAIKVWGRPAEFIVARYKTEQGEKKQSLLLTSGWWGLARHFHYVPEVLAAVSWTIPALDSSPAPYFYTVFLVILLTDRAYRDDARCASKYRQDWDKYRERVPFLILPKVF